MRGWFLLGASLELPSLDRVDAELLRVDLAEMIRACWPILEPGTPLSWNWHVDVICEHLAAVSAGEITRLIVNIPPRGMKSTTVSVVWPVWDWLTNPQRRFLFASYAQVLATRDAVKSRRLIQSAGVRHLENPQQHSLIERIGYQGVLSLLGHGWALSDDQNLKQRYENDATGYRISTSVGGSATGEGGDILVIDDPHKADEVNTESGIQRQAVLDWHDETWTSRLNNRKTGSMVLIMQRLHEQDLTGHLLDKGGWEHLCLPNEYEPSHPFVWPRDIRSEAGELLWADRIGDKETSELKRDLGSYGYAGQYQQRPAPAAGGIFQTAWWRYYDRELLDELTELLLEGDTNPGRSWSGPHFTRLWQSWDTSLKEKTSSDYAVGQVWAQFGADRWLLRQRRDRMGLTDTVQAVRDMTKWVAERFPDFSSHSIYIEQAANGPEVRAALRRELQGMIPVVADRDKTSRAYAITPQLEAGNVLVPGAMNVEHNGPDRGRTPAWVQDLIHECAAFPNASNDDQVDCLTQALDPRRRPGEGQRRQGEDRFGKGRSVTGGMKSWDV